MKVWKSTVRQIMAIALLLSSAVVWADYQDQYCGSDLDADGVAVWYYSGLYPTGCPVDRPLSTSCWHWSTCNQIKSDNCPYTSNSDQLNTDSDSLGNACDTDDDNDSVLDTGDVFPLNPAEWADTDNDTIGNNADWDDDNDGVPDTVDAAPLSAANATEISLPLDSSYKGLRLENRQ